MLGPVLPKVHAERCTRGPRYWHAERCHSPRRVISPELARRALRQSPTHNAFGRTHFYEVF